MFNYPKQAEFHGVVAKAKIYAHAKPGAAIKARFTSQVSEIVWKYKLSPETINFPARHGINEIQVFEVTLKSGELDDSVLRTIDRAVPFPILFHLIHGDRIRFAAAYKRPSEADSTKWVIEGAFFSPWQDTSIPRETLPVALDLANLYEQIVRRHLPLPARTGESLREQVVRLHTIRVKEKECFQLEARLGREKQFNRKVELNVALRKVLEELATLYS